MTANSLQGSAKIYQFPAGGRAGVSGRRYGAKPADDVAALGVTPTAACSSWYHEEAIREAEATRGKNG